MNNPRSHVLRTLSAFLLASTIAGPISAQTAVAPGDGQHYTDKLFGKQFTFTPTADEVMVKFRSERAGVRVAEIAELLRSTGVTSLHDAVAQHRYGVYRIPTKGDRARLIKMLRDAREVRAVARAVVDQEGFTKYFVPDELTVQFVPELAESEMHGLIESFGCTIVSDHWTPGYYTLRVESGADTFERIRAFMDLADVQFAELNVVGFNDALMVPSDTNYAQQWALNNDGTTGGTADADVDAQEAWEVETGHPDVLVAVIDTGVDWDHPDLQGNIWQNLAEDADNDGQTMQWDGTSWQLDPDDLDGVDDDANGQVDDLIGWDFGSGDNDPDDTGNHGTACAGIIAAVTDNATGVAGLAPNCRIMPLKVNLISGMNANRADAINYAASFVGDYDGLVLSNSWRMGSGDFTAVRNAVINAKAAGAVLCFASGNSDTTPISFPAIYEQAIAVGATSECDERKSSTSCDGENWWGSNFGDSLSISAPGVHIYTTDRVGASGYTTSDYNSDFNGTSSATPHVAAAAALVISLHNRVGSGTALTPDEVQEILELSADPVGGYDYNHEPTRPGHSLELGYGRLNVNRALQEVIARAVISLQPDPVDIALSIDRSGSMTGAKLSAAQNAASQVVRLMNTGDRIAVTSYSTGSSVDYFMNEITSEVIKDNAIGAINGLAAGGWTSIGGGLGSAQGQFLFAAPANYPQSIILMSDGMSNTAPWVGSTLPLLPAATDVYTIGFATSASSISEDTLQTIASDTGGEYFFAGADGMASGMRGGTPGAMASSGAGMELIKSYQLSLENAAQREVLEVSVADLSRQPLQDAYYIDVDRSFDQIRFNLLWEDPNTWTSFLLTDPSGRTFKPFLEDKTLTSYVVYKPTPGTWRLDVSADARGFDKLYTVVSGYSLLTSDLNLINAGLYQPLTLQHRLLENGAPVLGAKVVATVTSPWGEVEQFSLADDGKTRDGAPRDGVYGAVAWQTVNAPGSYTVESFATGVSDRTDDVYQRYANSSFFVEERISPVHVSLPDMHGIPGQQVRVPIQLNSDVYGRGLDRYEFILTCDPSVLQSTGRAVVKGSSSNGWGVEVSPLSEWQVQVSASGPALEDRGVLLFLDYKVVGKHRARSSLKLDRFTLNDGKVPVSATAGELTVDSPLAEQLLLDVDLDTTITRRRDDFGYDAVITNHTGEVQVIDFWSHIHLPNGRTWPRSGEIYGPTSLTLDPWSSQEFRVNHVVGKRAPFGDYEYNAFIGNYPSVEAEDTQVFTIVP